MSNIYEEIKAKINWPVRGKYVVAVSGGADSVTLLDLLVRFSGEYELVVAHYDHAIRPESTTDESFVEAIAKHNKLDYHTDRSDKTLRNEAEAREARFNFLNRVREKTHSQAIITAHHQDDLIETSLLNLARGTGRRGLAPMGTGGILRPLISVSRDELRSYALDNKLKWHEDISNTDETNPRNFLRHSLLPIASTDWRSEYLEVIRRLNDLNSQIDEQLEEYLVYEGRTVGIDIGFARTLADIELGELIVYSALKVDSDAELNDRLVTELVHFVRIGKTGRRRPVSGTLSLSLEKNMIRILSLNVGSIEGK